LLNYFCHAALVVAGGVLLVTALVGFCGLYRLLGIHTSQTHEQL
jgi:hypothetical protein